MLPGEDQANIQNDVQPTSVSKAMDITSDDMPVLSSTTSNKDEGSFGQLAADGISQGRSAADAGTGFDQHECCYCLCNADMSALDTAEVWLCIDTCIVAICLDPVHGNTYGTCAYSAVAGQNLFVQCETVKHCVKHSDTWSVQPGQMALTAHQLMMIVCSLQHAALSMLLICVFCAKWRSNAAGACASD